jgi:hypothetical protein
MLVFNSLDELKPYYHEESNTYVFNDDVEFNFNLYVSACINAQNIKAWNINAYDINAWNIKASNIKAYDIKARNINAGDIYYYSVCFAYNGITCKSIQGRRDNHKHFVLDGYTIVQKNLL